MKLQLMKQGQFFICLPRSLVRAKEWQKGEDIKIKINDKGELVLYKG